MKITVICGICGFECYAGFNHSSELVVTCHNCHNTLESDKQIIGDLEDKIYELGREKA